MLKNRFFILLIAGAVGALVAVAYAQAPGFGGVMLLSGATQSVVSVSLSNTTFTNSTANATVGTISVVMNPASPAFSGTLTISNTNSGGFHLVGTTLETNSAGTTSGTYSDIIITATQAGASGAPSISPTLVGGTGIACAQGPSFTGTVPSIVTSVWGANVACVNNSDFSTAFMGNTANWLSCAGASPVIWYNVQPEAGSGAAPCSDYAIITDGGFQVLHQQYTCCGAGTDWANGIPDSHLASTAGDATSPGTLYPSFGIYVTMTLRLGASTISSSCNSGSSNCGLIDSYFWAPSDNQSTPFCEQDMDESYSLGYFDLGTSHTWSGATACPSNPSGTFNHFITLSSYHKIEYLLTSDGSTQAATCIWIDGTLSGCTTATAGTGPVSHRQVAFFTIMGHEFGLGCDVGTSNCTTHPIIGARDAYIQNYEIFSCTSWASGVCGGTTQFNSGGLIYWH
jgi:hypothetical protein